MTMKDAFCRLLAVGCLLLTCVPPALAETRAVSLGDLDLANVQQGWGKPAANRSVDGHPLRVGPDSFPRGIGSHAPGAIRIGLDGRAGRFTARVGVDAEVGDRGSVRFKVLADR
jgi:alpha-galactosidase